MFTTKKGVCDVLPPPSKLLKKFSTLLFGILFSLNVSVSIEQELKIINTYLANPEIGKKLYGDESFMVHEGGLTAYSQIVLDKDYYHIVGVPKGLYSYNNKFITWFELYDIGQLNSSFPKILADEWVKKSINGSYDFLSIERSNSADVYIRSDEPIENLLNPRSNYHGADDLESN
jgi:hypothetical protein